MDDKFQTNFELIRLYDENKVPKPVIKVGILPFIVGEALPQESKELRFLTMKPHAEAKHLGAPAFQIAKGTRRIYINERWCDMRDDDLLHADESFYEPLLGTALREGEEEVGLKPSNIKRMFDMGCFTFVSASRGIIKPLHMFAAEIARADDFAPFEATTLETRWMTPEEFVQAGRADHITIVQEMLMRLKGAF